MTQLTDEQIYGLFALAEEQNKSIQEALERIERHEKRLDHILTQDLPRAALTALKSHLDTVNEDAKATTDAISAKIADSQASAIAELNRAAKMGKKMVDEGESSLNTSYLLRLALTVSAWILAVCFTIFVVTKMLPSFDDIADRRATIERLNSAGGDIELKQCGGELCARVMTKQCNYGDYCVLDLK